MAEAQIPHGYKQTEAGVIPEDWEVVLLDAVANRGSGHTPDKSHPEYCGGDIKWISLPRHWPARPALHLRYRCQNHAGRYS